MKVTSMLLGMAALGGFVVVVLNALWCTGPWWALVLGAVYGWSATWIVDSCKDRVSTTEAGG